MIQVGDLVVIQYTWPRWRVTGFTSDGSARMHIEPRRRDKDAGRKDIGIHPAHLVLQVFDDLCDCTKERHVRRG